MCFVHCHLDKPINVTEDVTINTTHVNSKTCQFDTCKPTLSAILNSIHIGHDKISIMGQFNNIVLFGKIPENLSDDRFQCVKEDDISVLYKYIKSSSVVVTNNNNQYLIRNDYKCPSFTMRNRIHTSYRYISVYSQLKYNTYNIQIKR